MLSVLALGHLRFEQIAELQERLQSIELIDSHLPRDASMSTQAAGINRLIAGAANSWVLIVRERESVSAQLAGEIRKSITEPVQAWGYRIPAQPMYDGAALILGGGPGEVRLVHQRHARLREGEWKVEGAVIRLDAPLQSVTFPTAAEHKEWLRAHGVPHSLLRRLLIFLRNVLGTGALRSRATLRYLWLEAGYDMEGKRP